MSLKIETHKYLEACVKPESSVEGANPLQLINCLIGPCQPPHQILKLSFPKCPLLFLVCVLYLTGTDGLGSGVPQAKSYPSINPLFLRLTSLTRS